jgi:hypothetical protein
MPDSFQERLQRLTHQAQERFRSHQRRDLTATVARHGFLEAFDEAARNDIEPVLKTAAEALRSATCVARYCGDPDGGLVFIMGEYQLEFRPQALKRKVLVTADANLEQQLGPTNGTFALDELTRTFVEHQVERFAQAVLLSRQLQP